MAVGFRRSLSLPLLTPFAIFGFPLESAKGELPGRDAFFVIRALIPLTRRRRVCKLYHSHFVVVEAGAPPKIPSKFPHVHEPMTLNYW